MAAEKLTPLMEQYFEIKEKHPDSLLFFQVGDFYELFFEDAKKVASLLALTLTKRGKCKGEDIPLCGVPVSTLNHYVTKLVRQGLKVAICDQLSSPIPGQVVKRGVRQVLTPGTLTDAAMLDGQRPSYLFSFFPDSEGWGLIFGELLTAQLFATHVPVGAFNYLESELSRFFPDEIILPGLSSATTFETFFKKRGYWVSRDDHVGSPVSKAWLDMKLAADSAEKFASHPMLAGSLNQFCRYLTKNQAGALEHFKSVTFYDPDQYLYLDGATQRNLEIIKNNQDGTRKNTLLSTVDKACTPMGSRTVQKWLTRPLISHDAIMQRQNAVVALLGNISVMSKLGALLCQLSDIERVVGRISLQKAAHSDYIALKRTLSLIPDFHEVLSLLGSAGLLGNMCSKFGGFEELHALLNASLTEDPAGEGYYIKGGFNEEFDRLRVLVENAQQEVLRLETTEIERTGIPSLKIRYNSISGYSIEVTKTHGHKIPQRYVRQQTLMNRERYVTEELLALQSEIVEAQKNIGNVQDAVYETVKTSTRALLHPLRSMAYAFSYLDALFSFAQVAYDNDYVAPTFHSGRDIIIKGGRHPVVEQTCDGSYIPNDTQLTDEGSLWIITGPNMGGKSTYLRQVALISLLAQCGSLVPASQACLPILDRIFTRIGSGDNLAEGKSTFLVEMEETAAICMQATSKSLVILDEVGRGTSTYDGLAIAQSVVEYIFTKLQARCLFATHYHELTTLESLCPGIKNYHMLSRKTPSGIIFQHKIAAGIAQKSFGIDVARLAGLPDVVIARSEQILTELAGTDFFAPSRSNQNLDVNVLAQERRIAELEKALAQKQGLLDMVNSINLDELSPKAAFDLVWKLKGH